jgi:uncharacterized protein
MQTTASITTNLAVLCGFIGWLSAQGLKFIFSIMETHKVDFTVFVSTGGMPSSHSSLVSALTTSVGLTEGFDSPLFAVALGLALIVMFDAQSFRRAAGQQARLLNQIVDEFFKEHHFPEKKLGELLGHTRFEVLLGMLLGVLVALLVHHIAG